MLLAASCGSSLIHRSVWQAGRDAPAQALEFGLSLLSFVLASAGVLLLVLGSRLFDARRRDMQLDARRRTALLLRPEMSRMPAGRAFDTREGVALMQARHALDAARTGARSRLRPAQPECDKPLKGL